MAKNKFKKNIRLFTGAANALFVCSAFMKSYGYRPTNELFVAFGCVLHCYTVRFLKAIQKIISFFSLEKNYILTSVSKKLAQHAVVIHYCCLCKFF